MGIAAGDFVGKHPRLGMILGVGKIGAPLTKNILYKQA